MFVDALARPAAVLDASPEQLRAIDFRRDVLPALAKCLPCHAANQSPPVLDGDAKDSSASRPAAQAAMRLYEQLLAGAGENRERPFGKYVHPGRARTSPSNFSSIRRSIARTSSSALASPSATVPPANTRSIAACCSGVACATLSRKSVETVVFIFPALLNSALSGNRPPLRFEPATPAGPVASRFPWLQSVGSCVK